jgi:STE24 endopeptidase
MSQGKWVRAFVTNGANRRQPLLMAAHVRFLFLGVFLLAQAIELGLITLNLREASGARGVPPELKGLVPRRVAERARRYAVASGRHALVRGLFDAACTACLLFGGALPWLDRQLANSGLDGAHRFVAFLAIASLGLVLLDLPFAWWRARAIEQPFGFGRASLTSFVIDRARSLSLAALVILPLLYATWAILRHGGDAWWLWLFAAIASLQLSLQWLWPALAASRLAHARPVTGGPLPARLEALTAAAGFRSGGVFVVEASRRSGHANACLVGLFRPRVMLDDTLLARLTLEEVAAVTAHEIGHFRLRHQVKRLVLAMTVTFAALALTATVLPWAPFYLAFGFEAPSLHAAVALVSLTGGALTFWMTPLNAALSRRQEQAADAFAVRLFGRVGALASALQRLSQDNLANPWPHPWYAAWRFSHPPLANRLVALVRAADAR